MDPLPLLDRHSTVVPAPPAVVREVAGQYAQRLATTGHPVLGRLLGTEPASGFRLEEESRPGEVVLAGQHRFSRYRLVFAVDEGPDGATTVSALSYASFPGRRGRAYRALLLGTGGHVRAVRHMLHTIRDRAARDVGRGRG